MLIDQVAQTSSFSLTAIARNVRDLPDLIEQHGQAVRGLEKILAKYLQNPDALPPQRPMCKPSKKDPSHASYPRGTKVDAIDYMTKRIHDLEILIKEVRASVDNRNPLPYGFATFEAIDEAHSIAYAARKKAVKGSTIRLAPRPNDIIWKNMHLTPGQRRTRRFINSFWMLLLTLLYAAPNAMIAIFLVQLANLGAVWPAFHRSLSRNTTWWAIVQGVASPAITSLVYLILPPIFRRLSMRAGDRTKTARDRHVAGKLYTFFVFNYLLVFSIFSTAWSFAANVIESTNDGEDAWKAILDADFGMGLFISLCNISPFWITWLLQRNLGAAVDLAQLWQLFWSFCVRKMSNPTPREMIELTAPPAFDYAAYYNFCLFYSTVALCFTVLQPLVLPAAALYFALDVYLKKYLLLYIFITKTESGGMFWRMLFNRLIFATILMTLVVFMSAWVHGDGGHVEAYTVVPLPVILLAFKFYCRRVFDDKIHYVTTNMLGSDEAAAKMSGNRVDKLSKKFGHPALYKPLITPMVHAKAQHKLASIYAGRLSDSNADSDDINSISGYSDTLALDQMMPGQVGRPSKGLPKFEMVPENRLDFAFYKSRAEFRDEHGGHGGIYGRAEDIDRPDTPGSGTTWVGTDSRPSTPSNHGVLPPDWKALPTVPISHDASGDVGYAGRSNLYMHDNDSQAGLMRHAYQPGYSPPGHEYATYNPSAYHAYTPSMGTPGTTTPAMRDPYGQQQAPGILGGGPRGYGELPQHGEDDASPQSYFRGGASTGRRNQSSRDDTPDDRSNQF